MHDEVIDPQALTSLQETLITSKIETPATTEGSLLFQACSHIAQKMGFSLPLPLKEAPSIEDICHLGKIRYRKTTLSGNWWKQDHGHFVAFFEKNRKPVAVYFLKKREYWIYDPETGENQRVNAENAALLASDALMLYPPFPEEAQTFRGALLLIISKIRREYVSIFLIGMLSIVLGFAFPVGNKILYDYVIPNYNYTIYNQLFFGLFVVIVSSGIFSFNSYLLAIRIKGLLTNRIQIGLWDRLLRLPIPFFRSFEGGDLLLRTQVFDEVKDRLSDSALSILINSFFSLFYIIIMFVFSWQLTLIGVSLIVIWEIFATSILIIKIRYEKERLASTAKIQSFLVQVLNAINKVRTTGVEKRIFSKWARDFAYNQSLTLKILQLKNTIQVSSVFIGILFPLSLYSYVIYVKSQPVGKDMTTQFISVGTFLAFLGAFTPFTQGLIRMINTITKLSELIPFWKRVHPLLSSPLEEQETGADPGILKGNIEVKNLHFRYEEEGPLILKDVNLSIKPGELVGLVGKTGCGKSTLCRLLFGFEKGQPNTLFFDDQDLTELNLLKIRQQIGFVFQENKIFNGSIYDNLTCNRPCSADELNRILALTTFDRELDSLPMGLDTLLSSIGGLLSGGQKQKILLARALLNEPQILIIDEGLNTLDNATQQKVLKGIKELNKTVILTSHQINVMEMTDRIYVMEKGEITASGSFEELAHHEGIFKRFRDQQILNE